jgi:hypothetical protein
MLANNILPSRLGVSSLARFLARFFSAFFLVSSPARFRWQDFFTSKFGKIFWRQDHFGEHSTRGLIQGDW